MILAFPGVRFPRSQRSTSVLGKKRLVFTTLKNYFNGLMYDPSSAAEIVPGTTRVAEHCELGWGRTA